MQTLNVGAGRTDTEYKAAEEQRRADLLAESRSAANYFFVAAGLAAIGGELLLVRLNFVVNIGALELLALYGRGLAQFQLLVVYSAMLAWVAILVGLGFAARRGWRWAFLAGVILYSADMIPLAITFSWLSMGVHGFFIFKWFQGQRALQELNTPTAAETSRAKATQA